MPDRVTQRPPPVGQLGGQPRPPQPPAGSISEKYAYHLPCHLSSAGREGASIELLGSLCGADITDLAAGCCGLAGTYGMQRKNYELSSQIAESLRAALEASQTKNILTECAACGMQIVHLNPACSVRHPIKLLADCYTKAAVGPAADARG